MKRILLPILAIILAACLSPSEDQPAPSALPTVGLPAPTQPPPTATVSPSATPDPLDSISPEVRELGEEEAREILGSIEDGSIEYVDYGAGSITEAQIDLESFKAQTTADWYFDNIVTATAKDKDGNKFKVVWNKDENHWVRAERTKFRNIDQMVKTGDYVLVLLTQPEIGEPFPEGTEKARYYINVGSGGIEIDGENIMDTFLHLGAIRADFDYDFTSSILSRNTAFEHGRFTKGTAPQRSHGVDLATLTDGREIVIVPQVIQNADGKNIIVVTGIDPRYYDFLTGPTEVDRQGITTFQNTLDGNRTRIVPVFPTDDPEHWGNIKKHGYGDGTHHSIMLYGSVGFKDNVIVSLLKPGEIFDFLPDEMKDEIREKFRLRKIALETGETPDWLSPFLFEGGVISDEFARALSRFIFEASFDKGFK
jgi:hypothetical protein